MYGILNEVQKREVTIPNGDERSVKMPSAKGLKAYQPKDEKS
jgi:hypothetical protein